MSSSRKTPLVSFETDISRDCIEVCSIILQVRNLLWISSLERKTHWYQNRVSQMALSQIQTIDFVRSAHVTKHGRSQIRKWSLTRWAHCRIYISCWSGIHSAIILLHAFAWPLFAVVNSILDIHNAKRAYYPGRLLFYCLEADSPYQVIWRRKWCQNQVL